MLFVIISIAIFLFISIISFPINTVIVTSIFTFKVYFLNFSYAAVVRINLPGNFLRDHNGNNATQLFCVIVAIVPHL